MDLLKQFVDVLLHLDKHLAELTAEYGTTTYLILLAIIFAETGLVILPFLPGDSLLFAAGALAALGQLDPWLLFLGLSAAAIVGDSVNYAIGKRIGRRAFDGSIRFLKKEHLDRTHAFYEKHGAKTIVLARFVPIVRTFAPFVAGVGEMSYGKFIAYNVFGGLLWCGGFIWAGYFFGNMPWVKANFSVVILAIIVLSVLPMVLEVWKMRREALAERDPAG
jgi:membrane-associated protein